MNVSPPTCIRIEESSATRRCGLRGLGQPLANGQRRGIHAGALPLQMTTRFSHHAAYRGSHTMTNRGFQFRRGPLTGSCD